MTTTTFPNWFAMTAEPFFESFLRELDPLESALQLGAFTGDATDWLVRYTKAQVWDVDTWAGSDEHAFDFEAVRQCYEQRRVGWGKDRVWPHRMTTDAFFHTWALSGHQFDFVYIDADHHAPSVLSDAVNAWPLLRVGGLMAFDDYLWSATSGRELDSPAPAIDAFRHVYADRLEVLYRGPQFWVRRTA